jgi:hypothetical protein|nr:MAG TPA: PROTEIN/RNA Complex, archaeal, ribosomal, 50S, protein.0A [Bacteriophage sp.]DAQ69113.1 MAG TPA: PROTEIN/RNA Complex, archaeal, ribosomal, 50S, protein.0A [Caudoviricetes sp.]
MTESEAIEELKYDCNELGKAIPCDTSWGCSFENAYGMAIKALEKQISKKPTPIDYEKYIDVIDNARFLRGAYWCPNCKHVVKSGSFCKDCGQKLDWENA